MISNFPFIKNSWFKERRKLQLYGNTKLAIMPTLPILCNCEKLDWIACLTGFNEQNSSAAEHFIGLCLFPSFPYLIFSRLRLWYISYKTIILAIVCTIARPSQTYSICHIHVEITQQNLFWIQKNISPFAIRANNLYWVLNLQHRKQKRRVGTLHCVSIM